MNTTHITVGATKILVLKIFTIFMLPCAIYMMNDSIGSSVTEYIIDPQAFIIRMDWFLGHIQRCLGDINLMQNYMHSNVHWLMLDQQFGFLKQDIAVIQSWQINPNISGAMKDKIQMFMEMANATKLKLDEAQRFISYEIDTYSGTFEVDDIGREIRLNLINKAVHSCAELHYYFVNNIKDAL